MIEITSFTTQINPSDKLLALAEAAKDEASRCDDGDYRARHLLMDFVAEHPEQVLSLATKEESTVNHLRRRRNFWRDRAESAERTICEWYVHPNDPPPYVRQLFDASPDWKTRHERD